MQKKNHPPHSDGLHEEKHPKQDFQVERIAFFSDAVFAIAITLLIIEFRPPRITATSTYNEVWGELKDMKFKLFALLISFVLVINYWMRHHQLFRHIHNYNKRIIMANMAILFPIIFFPFTTSFLYESINSNQNALLIPYRLFFLNNLLAAVLTYYFYWLVIKKEKQFTYPMPQEEQTKFQITLGAVIASFTLVLVLSFISFEYSFLGLIPSFGVRRFYKYFVKNKKIPAHHAKQTGGPGH
jgi:uncharacterized membrane protein